MLPLPKRSKSRITRAGMIYERRMIALRRLQAQHVPPLPPRPRLDEIISSEERWRDLRHLLP